MSQRASHWETAGAWLHVWTPPRGVEVPEPPLRRIALVAVILLVVVGGTLAAIAPSIQRGKVDTVRRDAREEAQYVRAQNARLRRDQRLMNGDVALERSASVTERAAQLTRAIGAAIATEANRRHADGELESPTVARVASCRRRTSSTAERLRLECLAPTSYVDRGDGKRAGSIGYPFLAGGSLRTGRFAFCKSNPPPGEKFAQSDNRELPQLPDACAF